MSDRPHAVIRFVLFDAGNTLVHLDYVRIADVLAAHDHPITPGAIRRAEYAAKEALDRALAPEPAAPASVEGLIWADGTAARFSYFGAILDHLGVPRAAADRVVERLQLEHRATSLWRVIEPDTPAILDALRDRGLTLAVVSNADGRIEGDLERSGLGSRFAAVVDSSVVGLEKPDPAIFHLALERLGATPDAALYVGDILAVDVMGAERAGLRALLLDPLGCYPGRVACARIRRLAELLDLLPGPGR